MGKNGNGIREDKKRGGEKMQVIDFTIKKEKTYCVECGKEIIARHSKDKLCCKCYIDKHTYIVGRVDDNE